MKLVSSVQEAVRLIELFEGRPEDLELAIPAQLLDHLGMNMAIITDRVLARGWEPDGASDADGCRIFRYREMT